MDKKKQLLVMLHIKTNNEEKSTALNYRKLDFGCEDMYVTQLAKIRYILKQLRELRPHIVQNWKKPDDWELKAANIHGSPVKSLTITLTPNGCSWANQGGCTMCGEYAGSTAGKKLESVFHFAQFASALSSFINSHEFTPEWLRIYQEGNYLVNEEVDQSNQTDILKLASSECGVKRITIECMAKFIKEENVTYIAEAVRSGIELEMGMGFESANDIVRNICVNKGETLEDYKRAINILKRFGIRSLAYVLLKPPFLTEQEAIDDAIATIQIANDIGFDAISLQPITLHKNSLVHALYSQNLYKLPWLWSVIHVAKSASNINDFRIGGFGFSPRPVDATQNFHNELCKCDCNDIIWEGIKKYGENRNLKMLTHLCTEDKYICKNDWIDVCHEKDSNLADRINLLLDKLDVDKYINYISISNFSDTKNRLSIEGESTLYT